MFDPRPLCCSSLTTAVGGTTDTNFVDSAHPTVARITNRLLVNANSAGNVDIERSTIGYVYTLGGTVVSWGSQLQKIVALSTTKAEYVAITEASKDRDH